MNIFKNHCTTPIFLEGIMIQKKLQNYSPRLGTVIFEAFSLRKRNSMRHTTRAISREKKIFNNVLMMTKLDNDNNGG